jgi:hypothetical protein
MEIARLAHRLASAVKFCAGVFQHSGATNLARFAVFQAVFLLPAQKAFGLVLKDRFG